MSLVSIEVTISGVTPLLMNKFTDAAAINAGSSSAFKGDKGTPREQAEAKLYIGHDGKIMVPQPNLFRCIVDGGIFFKAGKKQVTTAKSSLIPACIDIDGLELPLTYGGQWEVDTRAVVNPSTAGRMQCHRPSFHEWAISFTMNVDTTIIPVKLAREILDAAGKRIGLGDFRPARKGPFGKFVVTQWKEREVKKAA